MDKKENLSQPIKQETEQRFPIFFILLIIVIAACVIGAILSSIGLF